jgi:hypothetical protein
MEIEIFKTKLTRQKDAHIILDAFERKFPFSKFNFDLEDCDRILRLERSQKINDLVFELMKRLGFDCKVIEG